MSNLILPPRRVGFDMDGVIADFSSAFRDVERGLFGAAAPVEAEPPELEAEREENATAPAPGPEVTALEQRRRLDAIWNVIHQTPDFWTTLRPLGPGAVPRIHEMMLRHGWEVFFITRRPATAGQTVQRQTQQWLHAQGFDLPSVLVISGSRGAAAGAIRLDYHVDDNLQNCLDVAADSPAQPILIDPDHDGVTARSAARLRIGIARSIGEALDMLEEAAVSGAAGRTLLGRFSKFVGWK